MALQALCGGWDILNSPADIQAATLTAAGVNPFAQGVFKQEDMMGFDALTSDALAMQKLRTQILGVV